MIAWDNVTAEEPKEIEAPAAVVWGLVTDLSRTPGWNRETESTVWVAPHTEAAVGAVFQGTNRRGDRTWTVDCHVTVADAPTAFEWTVLDPSEPSSSWWYRLDAVDRWLGDLEHDHAPES